MDIGKTWYYNLTTYAGSDDEFVKLEIKNDTLINGELGTVLSNSTTAAREIYHVFSDNIIIQGKQRQIFRYIDGDFRLLYDFGLELGDTIGIYVNFVKDDTTQADILYQRLDSLKMVNIGGEEVTAQYFTSLNHDVAIFDGWHYEFIGSQKQYFIPTPAMGCWGDCPVGLTCYTSGDTSIEPSTYDERTCQDFISNIRDVKNVSAELTVYPNPVAGNAELTITVPPAYANRPASISLFNGIGQTVAGAVIPSGSATFQMAIPDVPAGMFYLRWATGEARGVKAVVIGGR